MRLATRVDAMSNVPRIKAPGIRLMITSDPGGDIVRMPISKVDANQPEIVAALRAAGYSVQHLHMVGQGCPDILVSGPDGCNVLMEIKMPGEKLNEVERRWHDEWPGEVHVVYSAQDALDVMGVG